MGLNNEIKTAYNAPVVIPDKSLFSMKSLLAALPIAIIDTRKKRSVVLSLTKAIAIMILAIFQLARKSLNFIPAIIARYDEFILPSGLCGQSLPFNVTGSIAARYARLGGPFIESSTTDRASTLFLAATIITVVLASVLMGIDKAGLLARVFGLSDLLPATASA